MSISPVSQSGLSYSVGNISLSNNAQLSGKKSGGATNSEDPTITSEVRKLKEREREVRAHENAHKSAGGAHAGTVSYTYTRGPDGKVYITGGEVSIDVSEENSPAATIRKMEQVKAAALAPADPSSQDQSVAAKASMIAMKARQEASKLKEEEAAEVNGTNSQKRKVDDEREANIGREVFEHISVYA